MYMYHTDPFQQPNSPPHIVIVEACKEKQEHENGTFHRQYAKRGKRFKHKSVNRQSRVSESQSDSIPSHGSDSRYETGSRSQVPPIYNEMSTAKLKHRQTRYVKTIKNRVQASEIHCTSDPGLLLSSHKCAN